MSSPARSQSVDRNIGVAVESERGVRPAESSLMSCCHKVPFVLIAWVASGCGGVTPPESASHVRTGSAEMEKRAFGSAHPDCRVTARDAESPFKAWNDINQLMVWRDQNPTGEAWRWDESRLRSAEPRSFSSVRAFAFGFREVAHLDSVMAGCYAGALSTDGRLCPSVIAPGRELTTAQVEKFYALAKLPRPRILLRCAYQPNHAFVFYGADGTPVAELGVCFTCGQWAWSDGGPVQVSNEAYDELAELCRELGLEGCPSDEKTTWDEKAYRAWERSGAPARPSATLGISPSRRLTELTEVEKRKLCAWRIVETRRSEKLEIEFDDGGRVRFQSYDECLERFPRCEVTLGEVESSNFHVTRDANFAAPTTCLRRWALAKNGHCLWGLEVATK
jgi:hypothetical protein